MNTKTDDATKEIELTDAERKAKWLAENPDSPEARFIVLENKIEFLWEKTGMHFKDAEFAAFCATRKPAI